MKEVELHETKEEKTDFLVKYKTPILIVCAVVSLVSISVISLLVYGRLNENPTEISLSQEESSVNSLVNSLETDLAALDAELDLPDIDDSYFAESDSPEVEVEQSVEDLDLLFENLEALDDLPEISDEDFN